jgi:glycosyltransferase involved in cell wall biosynthesis
LAQGLAEDDYEVIVVNDGSTDNGPAIVEEYCNKYPQIRLIHQPNGGVGSARNRGMEEAEGEYVYFVDADDWLLEGGLGILKEKIHGVSFTPEIVLFKGVNVDNFYDKDSDTLQRTIEVKYVTSHDYLTHTAYPGCCWLCIIARKVIVNNKIVFTNHVVSEDSLFMLRLLVAQDLKGLATNLNIYRYRLRWDSAMHSTASSKMRRFIADYLCAVTEEERLVEENSLPSFQKRQRKPAQWYVIVKLLGSTFSYTEIKELLNTAVEAELYPIVNPKSKAEKFTNELYHRPLLVYLISKPFRLLLPLHRKYYNTRESRYPTLREFLFFTTEALSLETTT